MPLISSLWWGCVAGGRSALVVTQGRDCTAMFESYHAFVQRPHELLKTFKEVRWT
jgi:hypothetical protein